MLQMLWPNVPPKLFALAAIVVILLSLFTLEVFDKWKFTSLLMIDVGAILLTGGILLHFYNLSTIAQIRIESSLTRYNFAEGTQVAGIKWKQGYAQARVYLTNESKTNYTDLDAKISTDLFIAEVGIISDFNKCEVIPEFPPPQILVLAKSPNFRNPTSSSKHETSEDETLAYASNVAEPVTTVQKTFRLRCSNLLPQSSIEIVVAVVTHSPLNVGPLYNSIRTDPKEVKIVGSYYEGARLQNFTKIKTFESP